MITAVDTSVLLDIFTADPRFGDRSKESFRRCAQEGGLVACEVVWAEIAGSFPDDGAALAALTDLGVTFAPMDIESSLRAGAIWRRYRAGGGRRTRVVADFLIGAHAERHGERLLTRDRGFFGRYFDGLAIVDPSVAQEP